MGLVRLRMGWLMGKVDEIEPEPNLDGRSGSDIRMYLRGSMGIVEIFVDGRP